MRSGSKTESDRRSGLTPEQAAFEARYRADRNGDVWREPASPGMKRTGYRHPVKVVEYKDGQYRFRITWGRKQHCVTVARFVWYCCRGKIPRGKVVVHRDTLKFNNRIENLELVTKAEATRRALERRWAKHRREVFGDE